MRAFRHLRGNRTHFYSLHSKENNKLLTNFSTNGVYSNGGRKTIVNGDSRFFSTNSDVFNGSKVSEAISSSNIPIDANCSKSTVDSLLNTASVPDSGDSILGHILSSNIIPIDSVWLYSAAESVATAGSNPELGNSVGHLVMRGIEHIHVFTGLPYWEAIVIATIGLRIILLPIAIRTVQGGARMAIMRPEMQKFQDVFKNDPHRDDPKTQQRYRKEMQALFIKYKVNPFRAMMMPLFQIPIFISFFMGLRDMGIYFPGFATGGAFWFTNLSIPDPYLILPVANSLTFLLMLEMGADGIQVSQKTTFMTAMRALAVVMVPLTMSMPQGLFVYWSTNNVFSIIQTLALKQAFIKKLLDIPDAPKPEDTPDLKITNPFKGITDALQKQVSGSEEAKIEVLDGIKKNPTMPIIKHDPSTLSSVPPSRKPKVSNEKK